MKRFSIIIPIYNEEKLLASQLSRLTKMLNNTYRGGYEIILVENGSTDRTLAIAKKLASNPFIRVVHTTTASYGQAFKRGIYEARTGIIVQFDLDFWDVGFLTKAIKLLKVKDIVVGSKNLSTSCDGRPMGRRITSKIIEVLIQARFGSAMTDTHGLKALKKSVLIPQLPLVSCTNHFFDSELLLRCENAGARVSELPVSLKEIRASRFSFFLRSRDVALELLVLLTRGIGVPTTLRWWPTLSRLTLIFSMAISIGLVKKLLPRIK